MVGVAMKTDELATGNELAEEYKGRTGVTVVKTVKILIMIIVSCGCFYFFLCFISLLNYGFRLLAGKTAGSLFHNTVILQSPTVQLTLGIFVTILLQSSSTSTSILVTLVSSNVITVKQAVPMVMGANVGTTLTNSIVSLTHISRKDEFGRAFAAATLHDMYNWMLVGVLLPVEIFTGYLFRVAELMVGDNFYGKKKAKEIMFVASLTNPLVQSIIQIDKNVLEAWSIRNDQNLTHPALKALQNATTLRKLNCTTHGIVSPCKYLFARSSLKDYEIALIILTISILGVYLCILINVKILSHIFKGHIATVSKRVINANFKYLSWLSGYLAIIVGFGLTVLLQSSSVFTAALVPLAGLDLISLIRIYPLIIGSNIGTTTTAIFASLASKGQDLKHSLHLSFCHLTFNLMGILLFYMVPFLRIPVPMARSIGKHSAKFRSVAFVYLACFFFLIPICILLLSFTGEIVSACVIFFTFICITVLSLINQLQEKRPELLPICLRSWDALPDWLHRPEPYDKCLSRINCCKKHTRIQEDDKAGDAT